MAEMVWTLSNLAPKTIQNYRNSYRRNISASLGKISIEDVSTTDLLKALAPLTPQTYFQTLMAVRVIYREAIAMGIAQVSPAQGIKPKKIHVAPKKFLTWQQVKSTDFGKYDNQIKFLALHGLRWGEAIVLTEDDVKDDKVYITKSKAGPTKTSSGNRIVPYFGYFKPFPKSRHAIANKLQEYGVTIHSLRKTYAYFLKSNQVHVTAAAKFLGHSNPLVTLKIYTLVRDEEIDEIGDALRKVI
jgi:integrase